MRFCPSSPLLPAWPIAVTVTAETPEGTMNVPPWSKACACVYVQVTVKPTVEHDPAAHALRGAAPTAKPIATASATAITTL